jgi:hypothetical protein
MHLFRGSLILLLSYDSIYILKLFIYKLLELISESSLYLVYLVTQISYYHFFVLSSITKKGEIEASRLLFIFW